MEVAAHVDDWPLVACGPRCFFLFGLRDSRNSAAGHVFDGATDSGVSQRLPSFRHVLQSTKNRNYGLSDGVGSYVVVSVGAFSRHNFRREISPQITLSRIF